MVKRVIKRTGAVVDFDRSILERSLRRAGASEPLSRTVASKIEETIRDGDTVSDVYRHAFEMLAENEKGVAMRYSLKKALFGFGPTGFPFEKFVAELFRAMGYTTTTNVHMQGTCITHEVDVLATAPERIAMEIKFHNNMQIRSDVKEVLYVKARFDDLTGRTRHGDSDEKGVVSRCILVTNTKFTKNAIAYANCSGVPLLGWGYPYDQNLQSYIKSVNAHPVTCLPSITPSVAKDLFDKDIVTCGTLLRRTDVLNTLQNADAVLAEAKMICTSFSKEKKE